MPRVTASFVDSQVARIRSAAAAAFAARGFHGTSMDDIIEAAGMSSSTVYRYFPQGKQQIVDAVLTERVDRLAAALQELSSTAPAPAIDTAFITVMAALCGGDDDGDLIRAARIAVNAWGELPRESASAELLRIRLSQLMAQLKTLTSRIVKPSSTGDADCITSTVLRYALGFLAEAAMTGTADPQEAAHQLAALADH